MNRTAFLDLVRKHYPTLAEADYTQIEEGASDTLLRDARLKPLSRVRTAVRAWVRHTQTDYENESRVVSRSFARERARNFVIQRERELFARGEENQDA